MVTIEDLGLLWQFNAVNVFLFLNIRSLPHYHFVNVSSVTRVWFGPELAMNS